MIKKILLVLGLFVAFIVGVIVLAFTLTTGLVRVADTFFADVANGDLEQARTHLSEEFRAGTSLEDLKLFLDKTSLGGYREATWNHRSIENSLGELQGDVVTQDGGVVPLVVKFVKENGDWKIYSLDKPSAGVSQAAPEEASLPSREEAAELVQQTTRDFAAAINANDFSSLHAQTAHEFQEQISLEKMAEIFGEFVEQKIDLSPLENLEPLFTTDPAVTAGGEMLLEGYYPSTPSRAYFTYRYIWRDKKWQLLGLNVNLKNTESEDAEQ